MKKILLHPLHMFFIYFSAIIQGISEAFPISSSAHMIAARLFLPTLYAKEGTLFSATELQLLDVALHLGTLFTIALYFQKDILQMIKGGLFTLTKGRIFPQLQNTPAPLLFKNLFYASLPAVLCGAVFSFCKLDQIARTPLIISLNCCFFGALLAVAQAVSKPSVHTASWPPLQTSFFIGCAQILAFFPGVSRLGICLTAACFLQVPLWQAVRFSFLLGFVSISGALFLKGITAPAHFFQSLDLFLFAKALGLSIAINLGCLRGLQWIIHRLGLWPFAVYRMVLGLLILFFTL